MARGKIWTQYSDDPRLKGELYIGADENATSGLSLIAQWLLIEVETNEDRSTKFIKRLLSEAANTKDSECIYGANVFAWQIVGNEYVIVFNIFNLENDIKEYVLFTIKQYVNLLNTYMAHLEYVRRSIKDDNFVKQYFDIEYYAEGHRAFEIAEGLVHSGYKQFY